MNQRQKTSYQCSMHVLEAIAKRGSGKPGIGLAVRPACTILGDPG